MTDAEIKALIKLIAPALHRFVTAEIAKAVAPLRERVAHLETRSVEDRKTLRKALKAGTKKSA